MKTIHAMNKQVSTTLSLICNKLVEQLLCVANRTGNAIKIGVSLLEIHIKNNLLNTRRFELFFIINVCILLRIIVYHIIILIVHIVDT